MADISRYWRPRSLDEVLSLLARPGAKVIGGGTRIHASTCSDQPIEVVDLQDVALSGVSDGPAGWIRVGATTTLQEMADDDRLPRALRSAARRERPSSLRTQSTLGALVAHPPIESELLAVLLVHEAFVETAGPGGRREQALLSLGTRGPPEPPEIVTSVRLATTGRTARAVTARTTADRPIVAVAARAADRRRLVALTGVADGPILLQDVDDPGAAIDEALRSQRPIDDFRGTMRYRRALAEILARRAVSEVTR